MNWTKDDRDFSDLFWAARKEQTRLKGETSPGDPAFKAVIAFADVKDWSWARKLIEASRLERTGADDALRFLAETQREVPERFQSVVHVIRGSVLYLEREFDEATVAFRRALDDPAFDRPAYAWNGLALVLGAKGEFGAAKEAVQKAFNDPKFDASGSNWYFYGLMLKGAGEYDDATVALRKALDDPEFDLRGHVWYELGILLAVNDAYDESIGAFQKALNDPDYDTPREAWAKLALVFELAQRTDEAESAHRMALSCPEPTGERFRMVDFGEQDPR